MNISITGASGFIGKALCNALLLQSHSISIFTRKNNQNIAGVKVVQGDLLSNDENLTEFADGADVIFHCAGEIKNEELMAALHLGGTKRLLDGVKQTIKKRGKPVHWVQLSSVGAYGVSGAASRGRRVIDEQSPEHPVGTYEITKTAADRLVSDFAQEEPLFTFTILRPTIVIGSRMPNESFHAMARMIKRGLFFGIGRKKAIANYVHVDDVVRALIVCLSDVRARGKTFIVSNDCPLELVISSIARGMNVPEPRWVVPELPLRLLVKVLSPWVPLPLTTARIDALTRQTQYSSELIRETLSFSPLMTIPNMIPTLLRESVNRLSSE